MTEPSAPRVVEVPPNDAGGRDLVFGDIHGCFTTVESALAELRYDPARDRLFSLGDTIDYGPRSGDALEWMQSRFTCTVRGNHEDMMRDWLVLGSRMWNEGRAWREHWASAWFPSWGGRGRHGTRDQRRAWRTAIEALPIAATVHLRDGGRVGLIHGQGTLHRDHGTEWDTLGARISGWDRTYAWMAMWARPAQLYRAPCEGAVPQRVRIPPGNCRSSR